MVLCTWRNEVASSATPPLRHKLIGRLALRRELIGQEPAVHAAERAG
jgi:hypothetical protein